MLNQALARPMKALAQGARQWDLSAPVHVEPFSILTNFKVGVDSYGPSSTMHDVNKHLVNKKNF